MLKLKDVALKSTMSSKVLIHLVPAAQGFNQSFFIPPLFRRPRDLTGGRELLQ